VRNARTARRWLKLLALLGFAVLCVALAFVAAREMRTSRWQARYFSRIDREVSFGVAAGPSQSIRFPVHGGPYDDRMGYARLPAFTQRLEARGFQVTAQARDSARLLSLADRGLFVPYAEKDQAGLQLSDDAGATLYAGRFPEHVYRDFQAIPPVLVNALAFIEDRDLLDDSQPMRNPAMNWNRFALAAAERVVRFVAPDHSGPGGSTLATQIQKFRHSPGGRTGSSASEKLRQMVSASLAAYRGGENTGPMRRAIAVHYLNTEPLAAQPGGGEIQGFGDGLAAWYGRDFDETNRLLWMAGSDPAESPVRDTGPLEAQALAFKQALSLLIAQRAPSYYLAQNNAALEELTDSYLRLLADNSVISARLSAAALHIPLHVHHAPAAPAPRSFVNSKAVTLLRARLQDILGVQNAYDLDRLDLSARSTLDSGVEQAVSRALPRVQTVEGARQAGLYGFQMLRPGDDPSKIAFSFTLYQRVAGANVLRVQTDSLNEPFDINQGARLNLGSTAKLRTLVLYLQIVSQLHDRYAPMTEAGLARASPDPMDALSRWAVAYLAQTQDRSLEGMLRAAVEREYPANPGEVFETGGGMQTFTNFEAEEDSRTMTVHQAFQHSVNLVFVRLMRDIVHYEMVLQAGPSNRWLADEALRRKYLTKFADEESLVFLARFEKKYDGATPDQALARLLAGIHKSPVRLAAALRSVDPGGSRAWFDRELRVALRGTAAASMGEAEMAKLYDKYGPAQFDLKDRAYLAQVHPMELWLLAYLRKHPKATGSELRQASYDERIASYSWLFRSRLRATQDHRIRGVIERDAYAPILHAWQGLGYPFQSITPSYGAAIGAAGDRPAALAKLMGVIASGGEMAGTEALSALAFAVGTPYETHFSHAPLAGARAISPAIVSTLHLLLQDVVQGGTARRLAAGLPLADGRTLPVSGKTGTGDQRFNVYARGGRLLESRKVNRTATFVFMIGGDFFGTITAFAHEPYAARFSYTSAMVVQLLKFLGPTLSPVLERDGSR
jgi:membrane peptidoglycan carboxypeptidase